MLRLLIVLVVGLVIGYSFGFKDAKVHKHNIAVRMLDRAGGSTRDKVGSDVDKKMQELEKP